jgi:RNA polymerase sigma-70 factor (ECF subfamily)
LSFRTTVHFIRVISRIAGVVLESQPSRHGPTPAKASKCPPLFGLQPLLQQAVQIVHGPPPSPAAGLDHNIESTPVHRWEDTDDVFQNAQVRLLTRLQQEVPSSSAHFFNLAASIIRGQLVDLVRYYQRRPVDNAGPPCPNGDSSGNGPMAQIADRPFDPNDLEGWALFHQEVDKLPAREREVFNLLWYHGLIQEDAAEVLGVTRRTIITWWHNARLKLHGVLQKTIA